MSRRALLSGIFRHPRTFLTIVNFAVLLLLASGAQAQDVSVTVPDTVATVGDTVSVPIRVSGLNQAADVTAYGFELRSSREEIAAYGGFATRETLTEAAGFTVDDNPTIPRVGAFGGTPLSDGGGQGVLIRVQVVARDTGSTTIALEELQFNDGSPAASPTTPGFTVQVLEANRTPQASNDQYATAPGEVLDVTVPAEGVLANDTDPNGDSLQASLRSGVSEGALTLNPDGTFHYAPRQGFTGQDTFRYAAVDPGGQADTATVTLDVREPNAPPTIRGLSDQTVVEDSTTGPLPFTIGDAETPADSLQVVATSGDTTLVPADSITLRGQGTDRTLVLTPAPDENGDAAIVVKVSDGDKVTRDTTRLRVTPVNDPPVTADDRYTPTQGQTLQVASASEGVLANDRDVDGDALTARVVSDPTDGALSLDGDGTFTYTPDDRFVGTDTFAYEASDGNGAVDTSVVRLRVRSNAEVNVGVEGDTVAVDDTVAVALTIRGLSEAADISAYSFRLDFDAEALQFVDTDTSNTLSGAAGFSATANSDRLQVGAFSATPLNDIADEGTWLRVKLKVLAPGSSSVSVRDLQFNDGLPSAQSATPTGFVSGIVPNRAPRAFSDKYSTATDVPLNVGPPARGVLRNDIDPDNDSLTVSVLRPTSNGTLTLNQDGTFQYDPDTGFLGTDLFNYKITDPGGRVDSTTVRIAVETDRAVDVQVRDVGAALGDTISVPVRVSNLDDAPDVTAYGFDVALDSTRIGYVGFETSGTLTEAAGFTVDDNRSIPRIGGFGATPINDVAASGTLLNVKFVVRAQGTTTITLDSLRFNAGTPEARPEVPHFTVSTSQSPVVVQVREGWNLSSVPFRSSDGTVGTLFPPCSNGFSFVPGQGYSRIGDTPLSVGEGFWLRCSEAEIALSGTVPDPRTVQVKQGWNIVGTVGDAVAVDAITTDPTGIVQSLFFGFEQGYRRAQELKPGQGYWIRVSKDGTLNLDGGKLQRETSNPFADGAADQSLPRLEITDAEGHTATLSFPDDAPGQMYSLPPVPPGDVFDVRFANGQATASPPNPSRDGGENFPSLRLQAVDFPIHLRLVVSERSSFAHEGRSLRVRSEAGEEVQLTEQSPRATLRTAVPRLHLALHEAPDAFALKKSYPNPATQSATIPYAVPEETEVTIEIFDVLGRRVTRLVRGTQRAGQHQVQVGAAQLPSGTYFVRMKADGFIDTRRLVVVQ